MICWYCHWGWPKAIRDIYIEATDKLGHSAPLDYGPAHVVWEDENFGSAQECLDEFDKYSENLTDYEKSVVRWSLEELLKLPDSIINAQPDDYDGENPQNYPPPKEFYEWTP